MNLFELNKNLKIAGQRFFIFIQIHKLTIKFYLHLRYVNISYYLKIQIPMCHWQFFKILSQNTDYVKNHCKERYNPCHLAMRNWVKNWKNDIDLNWYSKRFRKH